MIAQVEKLLEIQIRRMRNEDVDQIMAIEEVSFGAHHWSADSFCSEIQNPLGNYFCAINKSTNELIGYCGFWIICEEAHVTTIAVKKEYRKHHIGELLLQQMIETGYKVEAKWFTLEVRVSNMPALSLYKKYGFDSLGVRRKYYQDNNEDALIMWTQNIWESKFKDNLQLLKENLLKSNELILHK